MTDGMPPPDQRRPVRMRLALAGDTMLLAYLAGLSFVMHMLVAGNYGYFRDELYYLADGRHPQFGYVDQPPLIGWIAALLHLLANDNLVAIHVIPALADAALIIVTGLMALELGGGRFAQLLAALASLCALVFMATGSLFSMDVLDELWWAIGALVILRLLKREQPRLWLLFGLVAGVGLMTKLTMLFFGFSLALALLLTPERRHLRTPWPWLGGAIAGLFLLPYIIWNAVNDWPTWDFWHHYGGIGTSPLDFFANQMLLMNPFAVPLAIAGLIFYFRPEGKPYRVLGWTFIVLYALMTLIHVKPYFLPPVYPILFAPGALVLERTLQRRHRAWLRRGYIAILALGGVLLAPLAMPVLPPATFVSAYGFLTGVGNSGAGQGAAGSFPQYLGDRFGWDTMTKQVEAVYAALPPGERSPACVFTNNYGEAAALSLLGVPGHLPAIISGHNNYYLWGPGRCTGKVLIVLGYTPPDLRRAYNSAVLAARTTCDYCMTGEDHLPIFIFQRPAHQGLLTAWWPSVKHFD